MKTLNKSLLSAFATAFALQVSQESVIIEKTEVSSVKMLKDLTLLKLNELLEKGENQNLYIRKENLKEIAKAVKFTFSQSVTAYGDRPEDLGALKRNLATIVTYLKDGSFTNTQAIQSLLNKVNLVFKTEESLNTLKIVSNIVLSIENKHAKTNSQSRVGIANEWSKAFNVKFVVDLVKANAQAVKYNKDGSIRKKTVRPTKAQMLVRKQQQALESQKATLLEQLAELQANQTSNANGFEQRQIEQKENQLVRWTKVIELIAKNKETQQFKTVSDFAKAKAEELNASERTIKEDVRKLGLDL